MNTETIGIPSPVRHPIHSSDGKPSRKRWSVKIQDPSGHTRTLNFRPGERLTMGSAEESKILIKDPEISAPNLGEIELGEQKISVKMLDSLTSAEFSGLSFREGEIPSGAEVKFGATRLTFSSATEEDSLPQFPKGARPWKSSTEVGAKLLWQTRKVAATPLSVYISGETGTGKELIAHLLHAWSDRASGPFVAINCGALTPSLVESELFGHVKGSFTGADQSRVGAFLQAHNGTLFLDEVGNLPAEVQVKLLRFLEDGEIRPVGSDRVLHSQVRLVCATHLPLLKLVEEGKFRKDLYFRIASVTLKIPSLKERPEDIELLAIEAAGKLGKVIPAKTLAKLQSYSWPGNVRELQHSVERACGLAGPFEKILSEDLFEWDDMKALTGGNSSLPEFDGVLRMDEMEKILLLKALRISHGNRQEAAKLLGVARSTVFDMLKRHKIPGPRQDAYAYS
jgi:DNA-binding NtrC family response regulator